VINAGATPHEVSRDITVMRVNQPPEVVIIDPQRPADRGGHGVNGGLRHPAGTVSFNGEDGRNVVVSGVVNVVGRVTDLDLMEWSLSYRLLGDGSWNNNGSGWVQLASGEHEVRNRVLGTFDTTGLANGFYELQLRASDGASSSRASVNLSVEGEVKIAPFTLRFVDLDVHVGSLPLQVVRTYDSRNRNRNSQLGYGWKLEYRDIELDEDPNQNVILTVPGGRRVGFYHTLEPRNMIQMESVWVPHNATGDSLEMTDDNAILVDVLNRRLIGYMSNLRLPVEDYVVSSYRLRTNDGLTYRIDKKMPDGCDWERLNGLERLAGAQECRRDPNGGFHPDPVLGPAQISRIDEPGGDHIDLDEDGIRHSRGPRITFERIDEHIVRAEDPAGREVLYEYDERGDLVSVTESSGRVSRFVYNDEHLIVEVDAGEGSGGARMEYDEQGRLVAMVDPEGNRVQMDHRPDSRVEEHRDRRGYVTVTEYDSAGNIIARTDPRGATARWDYDGQGRMTRRVSPEGAEDRWDRDHAGRVTAYTDPLGRTTRLGYDGRGNLASVTDPAGNTTSFSYDANGHLATTTGPLGATTSFERDRQGRVTREVDAQGNAWGVGYDELGRTTGYTDPRGHTTSIESDVVGNPSRIVAPGEREFRLGRNEAGDIRQIVRPDGSQVVMQEDDLGRIRGESYVSEAADGSLQERSWGYGYTPAGRFGEITTPGGHSTELLYDEEGNMLGGAAEDGTSAEVQRDPRGDVASWTDTDGRSGQVVRDLDGRVVRTVDNEGGITEFERDASGRPLRVTGPDGQTVRYEYDAAGNRTALVAPDGTRREARYDAAGRLMRATGADGTSYSFEYDELGNVTALTGPLGTAHYAYDERGQMTSFTDPMGSEVHTAYSATGLPERVTDAEGHAIVYGYDEMDRVTSVVGRNGDRATIRYNGEGVPIEYVDPLGRSFLHEVDAQGTVLARHYPGGLTERQQTDEHGRPVRTVDSLGRETLYHYDEQGRVDGWTRPNGERILTTADDLGRIRTIEDARGLTEFEWDDQNRLLARRSPHGHEVRYTYNSHGLPAEVTTGHGTTHYDWYDPQRIARVVDPQGNEVLFDYDISNRLTEVRWSTGARTVYGYAGRARPAWIEVYDAGGALLFAEEYTYGALGRLARVERRDGPTTEYEYDPGGRITAETVTAPGSAARRREYSYDLAGNRTAVREDGVLRPIRYDEADRLLDDGRYTYTWDGAGNLASRTGEGVSEQYTFDENHRLTELRRQGGAPEVVQYEYDADGLLERKVVDGVGTRYVWDRVTFKRPQLIEELADDGSLLARTAFGSRGPVLREAGDGTVTGLHGDQLGSIRVLSGEQGALAGLRDYAAFGERLDAGADDVPWGYTGQRWEQEAGLVYLRARWYSPEQGRFLSPDPVPPQGLVPGGLHRYVYTRNNPVNGTDPDGLWSLTEMAVTTAIISILSYLFGPWLARGMGSIGRALIDWEGFNPKLLSGLVFPLFTFSALKKKGVSAGVTGGLEVLRLFGKPPGVPAQESDGAPRSHLSWAVYIYLGGTLGLGIESGVSFLFFTDIMWGLVWNVWKPSDYEGGFFTVSFGGAVVQGMTDALRGVLIKLQRVNPSITGPAVEAALRLLVADSISYSVGWGFNTNTWEIEGGTAKSLVFQVKTKTFLSAARDVLPSLKAPFGGFDPPNSFRRPNRGNGSSGRSYDKPSVAVSITWYCQIAQFELWNWDFKWKFSCGF